MRRSRPRANHRSESRGPWQNICRERCAANESIEVKPVKTTIINLHIPKTAGSTFRRQMMSTLPTLPRSGQIVGVDGGPNNEAGYYASLRRLAITAIEGLNRESLQFMSGHYRYRDVADLIAPIRDRAIITTFIRDPLGCCATIKPLTSR